MLTSTEVGGAEGKSVESGEGEAGGWEGEGEGEQIVYDSWASFWWRDKLLHFSPKTVW